MFVVRDDARPSDLVFQSSVTTFAAYNNWGGKSLYAFNSAGGPAHKVSFDRPYAMAPYGIRLDGAGDFLRRWEYNALRWLEREGYDVTYITDVDTHERGDALLRHRVFLSIGHDEYWSWAMRDHVEAARDRGINLVFLGANASFWQIRFEPGPDGAPNRTIVGYKDAATHEDPLAIDSDPANDHLVTGRWRDPPVSRSEASMIGVMYVADRSTRTSSSPTPPPGRSRGPVSQTAIRCLDCWGTRWTRRLPTPGPISHGSPIRRSSLATTRAPSMRT